ncbi:TPA: hypothetical protein H1005_03555 [archaeon]|uniref:Transcription regulator TrmB N-terminal domain-containing protein n=1 Tax=Candidatus Naiadarchaeum limnaeum TaxID=2756139 RepID=A0A832UR42_9ARCH|nr:hypothetical protein [Candidatus Naiadarchaeales archaeon SRR2090153.bin1042]HIK00122.1 hypothetical protein [Candidatus Naiadarchaeum limnaeum]
MKEHVEYLQNLGLTEYQSRALIVLFAKRELSAEEICKFSGIPQTKIYQVMNTLRDKELIECTISKPRIYRCAEPLEVLNTLIQKVMKRLEWLKNAKRDQIKKIKAIDLQVVTKEKVHPMFNTDLEIEA